MLLRSILVVALTLVLTGALFAGHNPPNNRGHGNQPGNQPGGPANQSMHLQGVVEKVGSGGLVMSDQKTNQQWRVVVPANASVHVTGTVDADSLRSGLFVELNAQIEGNTIVGKVKRLTIVTPSDDHPLGVSAAGKAKHGDTERHGKGEGKKHKPDGENDKAEKHQDNSCIVGKLVVGRGGRLTLQVEKKKLSFELSDDATIKVDVSDRSMIRRGDNISVQGVAVPSRQGMVVQAQSVNVKLSESVSGDGGDKKKPGKKSSGGEPRRPKKGNEKDDPPFDPDAK
jgi:hypothetical protein